MRYKKSVMAVMILAMLGLSGCAENQIPDMTGEEMQAVGEYVAYVMTKYDAGHGSRIMDLPPVEENTAPVGTPAPEEKVGMDPVDDTPVVDAPGTQIAEGEGSAQGEQPEREVSYSAEQVMGLPEGVTLEYTGQEVCDSYSGDSDAFAVTAADGKKLLVLKFSITNTLEQEAEVDLLSSQISYRIAVGEERSRKALPTMLPNDMAFYVETLSPGASAEAVLVVEVDADLAESGAPVTVQLKNESKSHTIHLNDET